jgi:hypothetical protein
VAWLGPLTYTFESDFNKKETYTYNDCNGDVPNIVNGECIQFRTAGAITFIEVLVALVCAGAATGLALLSTFRRTNLTFGTYKFGAIATLLTFCGAITW